MPARDPCDDGLRSIKMPAAIHDRDVVRAILDGLDLPFREPPGLPARSNPGDDVLA